MNFNQAIAILNEKNVKFQIDSGFSGFWYKTIEFDSKSLFVKSANILYPEGTTISKCNSGKYGMKFFG
jgi:hypothetical protein